MDVGCVVQNVGSLKAVADAVEKNIPLIERIVTVAGKTVKDPKNVMAKQVHHSASCLTTAAVLPVKTESLSWADL